MSYRAIQLQPGQLIYRRGEDGGDMFLVQEGAVEMLDGGEDGERVALFERGDFFGERAVLDHVVREHTLRAAEDSRLIRVDASGLAHMLLRNPEISVRMIRKLAHRLASTEGRLCALLAGGHRLDDTLGTLPQVARLIFGASSGSPTVFEVRGSGAAIGRSDPVSGIEPDIDLAPLDPKLTISRRHAAITISGGMIHLVEVRATNGTFINGQRLAAEQPARLLGGEHLTFGGVVLRFELVT